jgi:hypothetical protein
MVYHLGKVVAKLTKKLQKLFRKTKPKRGDGKDEKWVDSNEVEYEKAMLARARTGSGDEK